MNSISVAQHVESNAQLINDISLGSITFDGAVMTECLNDISTAACSNETIGLRALPSSCLTATQGNIANGESCSSSLECSSGFCSGGNGQCAAVTTDVALGGACNRTTQVCSTGSYCDGDNTCAALIGDGASCNPFADSCIDGDGCSTSSGTCVAVPTTAGQACAAVGVCGAINLDCVGGTCVARVDRGQSCALADCKADSICDDTSMLCVAP